MNKTEHLLTCLSEEGVEISHIIHKALRFGLHERWPNNPNAAKPSNCERLIDELNDLLGVISLLEDEKILPPNWKSDHKRLAKREKVLKYMIYARGEGALKDET